ncbi:Type IV secretion system protein VirB6 [Rickettsiales endosymbiont of Paramecium tredecaurelia]|nr:Type IV secretion system protein VirB6 [Candidatus Sarmatiella mevalonica]
MHFYIKLLRYPLIHAAFLLCFLITNNVYGAEFFQSFIAKYSGKYIEAPDGKTVLKTEELTLNDPMWYNTGIKDFTSSVFEINWDTVAVHKKPKKYLVLYRVDSRFKRAQVFVDKDFLEYKGRNGDISQYQANYESSDNYPAMFRDYSEYFNQRAPTLMKVQTGDVVHIEIVPVTDFFNVFGPELTAIGNQKNVPSITYTGSGSFDNRIIYCDNMRDWCNALPKNIQANYCEKDEMGDMSYKISNDPSGWVTGNVVDANIPFQSILACGDNPGGVCYLDKGVGVKVVILDNSLKPKQVIKDGSISFIHKDVQKNELNSGQQNISLCSGDNFCDFIVTQDGFLSFESAFETEGAISGFNSIMNQWDYRSLNELRATTANGKIKRVHFGRYAFLVEIGGAPVKEASVRTEYLVHNNFSPGSGYSAPPSSMAGTPIDKDAKIFIAQEAGSLWLRASASDKNLSGSVVVNIKNKISGSNVLLWIRDNILDTTKAMIKQASMDFYSNLVRDGNFQNLAMIAAALYISLYSLLVLTGYASIKFDELISRIMKVILVVLLIKPESWYIFNYYFLDFFTSFVDNILYYIQDTGDQGALYVLSDIVTTILSIFQQNHTIMSLLSELFSSWSTFYAMLIIIGICCFSIVFLSVLLSFITSYLGIMVMICVGPLVIICFMFETTKDITKQWLSILFFQALRPILMLVFLVFFSGIIANSMAALFLPFTMECKTFTCISFFSVVMTAQNEDVFLYLLSYTQRVFSFFLYCMTVSALNAYAQSILGMITGHSKDTGNTVF